LAPFSAMDAALKERCTGPCSSRDVRASGAERHRGGSGVVHHTGGGGPTAPAEARIRFLQVGQVVGNVDLVFQERFQRYDLEGALVGARQHHGGGTAVVVGAKPVQRGDAPSVPG
jgi:hypothetical protein